MDRIDRFTSLGFGLFVHFGLYSRVGRGEWYLHLCPDADPAAYEAMTASFSVRPGWAESLVRAARRTGCRYITLTTRHHDGFSLYDTCGLSEYDAVHSACGRDLVREFTEACRAGGIVPFFYHTLLDWHHPDYTACFPRYVDYLCRSVETLCRNYGPVGGFWFDGMWDKPGEDWQEDRLYGIIRRLQPDAVIINNTGLSEQGKVGHPAIDGVTFERGNPARPDSIGRKRAGEMCQVLCDHWGYAKDDCNYKPVGQLIEDLTQCRRYGCNYLLNTGLRGDGSLAPTDRQILAELGKWVRQNETALFDTRPSDIPCEGAALLTDGRYTYAVIPDVPMSADPNVTLSGALRTLSLGRTVREGIWLDDGTPVRVAPDGSLIVTPFPYGRSLHSRVARLVLAP